jgi:hypothetical protein
MYNDFGTDALAQQCAVQPEAGTASAAITIVGIQVHYF